MASVRVFASLLVVVGLCGVSVGWAEQPEEEPEVNEKADVRFEGETTVTATRTQRPLLKIPLSVTVVSKEEVEQAPVLQTDDLLRTVPGVVIPPGTSSAGHPTTHLVSMRGLGGIRALVLNDGVPVNDPFFGYIPWSMVPREGVEQVEVVRGGGSSLFGTYALGGTINIISQSHRAQGQSATLLYGEQDTLRADVSFAQPLSEALSLGVDITYFNTDGYELYTPPEDRGAADAPSDAESLNGRISLDFGAAEGWNGWFRADLYDAENAGTTELSKFSPSALRFAVSVGRPTNDGGALRAVVFHHDGEFISENTNFVPGTGRDEEYVSNRHVTPVNETGLSFEWNRPLSDLFPAFLVGVDVRRTSGEDRADLMDPSGSLTGQSVGGGTQVNGGLFAELGMMPSSRFEILLSARADHWSNRDGYQWNQPGEDLSFSDRSFTKINPRLSFHLDAGAGFGLRGAAYTAFRGPTLDELYRSFSSSTLTVLANPELDPETLVGGEIGVELVQQSGRFQLNLYTNDIDDLIGRSFVGFIGGIRTFDVTNLAQARCRGAEAMADFGLGKGWFSNVGLNYMDSVITEHTSNPERVGNRVPDVPEYIASLTLGYRAPGGFFASLRGRWVGEQYGDDANRLKLEPHTVLDASLSFPVGAGLEVVVIGENLTDESYVANARAGEKLGMPRRIVGGLRYSSGARR